MLRLSLLSLAIALAGCRVGVPSGPPGAHIVVKAKVKVKVEPPAVPVQPVVDSPVVEFFGIPLEGAQDVVFVLDASGSMRSRGYGSIATRVSGDPKVRARKIEIARAELIDALRRLPEGTRVNVIFFNSGIEAFAPGFVVLDEAQREAMVSWVETTAAMGSTALAPAMRTAFLMNARRVVLLSDGLGNIGGGWQSVLRDAREAMRGAVRIDTVGLGRNQHRVLLRALADESGGLYQSM